MVAFCGRDEFTKVIEVSEAWVNLTVIADVITAINPGALKNRTEPDIVGADLRGDLRNKGANIFE